MTFVTILDELLTESIANATGSVCWSERDRETVERLIASSFHTRVHLYSKLLSKVRDFLRNEDENGFGTTRMEDVSFFEAASRLEREIDELIAPAATVRAQGMETRRAETEGLGAKHDSPVAESDAPKSSNHTGPNS